MAMASVAEAWTRTVAGAPVKDFLLVVMFPFRGGRGSTGIRMPCTLPRVRALRAALPSRSCVAQGVVTRGGQHALAPRRRRPVCG